MNLSDRHRRLSIFALFVLLALVSLVVEPAHASEEEARSWDYGWIVEPSEAKQLLANEQVNVLDARAKKAYDTEHITGATHVKWDVFTPHEASDRGKLLDASALRKKLLEVGVDFDNPVLVVGHPEEGWGEDGRIVWMLRTLGHPAAALVNGGHAALAEAGVNTSTTESDPNGGSIRLEKTTNWLASREDVKSAIKNEDVVLLDTRERREYEGKTPYGESRGGHIPGAIHLYYRDLLGSNGRIRPDAEIRKLLSKRGIEPSTPVIAYCTGGVRSAWVTVVLTELGYDVKNYAGSTWDWAAQPSEAYPLDRSD